MKSEGGEYMIKKLYNHAITRAMDGTVMGIGEFRQRRDPSFFQRLMIPGCGKRYRRMVCGQCGSKSRLVNKGETLSGTCESKDSDGNPCGGEWIVLPFPGVFSIRRPRRRQGFMNKLKQLPADFKQAYTEGSTVYCKYEMKFKINHGLVTSSFTTKVGMKGKLAVPYMTVGRFLVYFEDTRTHVYMRPDEISLVE